METNIEPTNEELQQRIDELGAALDCACVELKCIVSSDPLHGKNLTTLNITLAHCVAVLHRHGIRTAPQPAA